MNVFDYIEKELDRIEVGYTSYDGTKITLTMDEVRELVQNIKKKYKPDGDVIYRQAAIDKAEEWIETYNSERGGQRERDAIKHVISGIKKLPSAQPEQTDCEYCHEDSDGYVTPLEKNCHAFVTYSPIDGWILSVKYGAWRKDVSIQYCPMCGRKLKNDK